MFFEFQYSLIAQLKQTIFNLYSPSIISPEKESSLPNGRPNTSFPEIETHTKPIEGYLRPIYLTPIVTK